MTMNFEKKNVSNFSGVVRLLQPSSEFGTDAKDISQNFNSPRRGTDCGDHPPITPMKLMSNFGIIFMSYFMKITFFG